MKIAIVGMGAIGSTFAYRLSLAGHSVTGIARGARLERLQRDGAVALTSGERATIAVAPALDEATPWDLVLVTVLAPQLGPVMPALRASAARKVMFMFNTFDSIAPLREAVGEARFVFGFPAGVFTLLMDGAIRPTIRSGTTVGEASWAKVFSDAGIPTVVEADMQSWLRTHGALVAPLMSMGTVVFAEKRGVSWAEARAYAIALAAGFAIVEAMGNALLPRSIARIASLPRAIVTLLFWSMSRTTMIRELGALGTAEPRMLIDMMQAAAPDRAAPLLAIRP